MNRGSKALNESHVYTQNQLEKLHFTYKKLNLNDPFLQMNEPYSYNLAPPVRSVYSKGSRSSKSKSSSGSSNASRKELVKAELLADQEKLKAERKLEKLKLQEKQFRLHQELEKAEILENFEEAENKLKLAKILDDLESVEKSDSSSIDECRNSWVFFTKLNKLIVKRSLVQKTIEIFCVNRRVFLKKQSSNFVHDKERVFVHCFSLFTFCQF